MCLHLQSLVPLLQYNSLNPVLPPASFSYPKLQHVSCLHAFAPCFHPNAISHFSADEIGHSPNGHHQSIYVTVQSWTLRLLFWINYWLKFGNYQCFQGILKVCVRNLPLFHLQSGPPLSSPPLIAFLSLWISWRQRSLCGDLQAAPITSPRNWEPIHNHTQVFGKPV